MASSTTSSAQLILPILQICESPRIWVVERFLSDEHCDHFINLVLGKQQRSQGFDAETGDNMNTETRTSSHAFLARGQDEVVAALENRIARMLMMPVENGEGFQILRYQIGQEYKPHYDYFDPKFPGSIKALERGGQRVATVLVYLSDVTAGGETIFPNKNIKVKPRKGMALFFTSVFPNGEIDPDSLHGSVPVIEGEKWVATKWVRQGVFV